MRTVSVLLLLMLMVGIFVACKSREREIHVTNLTREPIDANYVKKSPPWESLWRDYEGIQIGDDSPETGCILCNLAPGEKNFMVARFADDSRLKIMAHNSTDRKIIFLEALTGKELKDRNWEVVIR